MLVQIAPQLQQTASLLSDNQLALQRVLSSIGAGAELATVRIIEPQTEFKDGVNADLDSGEGSGETEFEGNSERFFQGQTTEQGHASEGILRDGDSSDSSPVPQASEQSSDAIYL